MKKLTIITVALIMALGVLPVMHAPHRSAAQDAVEITFSHIFPDERDVRRETIEQIAADFMAENPNVTVTIQITTDQYSDVFENALGAADQGNPVAVVQVEDTLMQIAIDSGYFVKIGDYTTDEQRASIPDILPAIRNYYNLDDEIWGLPWNASNPILYYNPAMFEAAGLDVDSPPATFDEITAACEALMDADIEGLEGCINWPITSWIPEQWVAMQGAMFVNNDNGRSDRATEVLFTNPAMEYVMTWWGEMADQGYYTYSGSRQAYTPEGLIFVTGKTAMHISTSAGLSNILKFAPTMGKFDPVVAPLPRPTADAEYGISVGGGTVWVMDGLSEAETRAAVDFAFFLTNTENIKRWHQASGYFPIRASAIAELEDEGWFAENPFYRIPLNQLIASEPNPYNAGVLLGPYTQVRNAVMDAIQAVVDGGADPADALADAKAQADRAIAEYNSIVLE